VKVNKVELKDLYDTIEYVGDVLARDEVVVYPKVSGKISEKTKEDGSPVNKGEAIAYIDRDEVGLKFERAPVDSSLTGVVGRIYVDIGSNVSPQTPIALVVNMDKVKVTLDIPEKYLSKISFGKVAKVKVDAYPGEEFNGKISKISPVLNSQTRSAPIEISIENTDYRLKSGMFARINLILEEYKKVPVILKEAVMGKEPNLYVYVVENQKAILRKVVLGIRQGPYFHVKEGLKESENVVIMGQQLLYDNAIVNVEEKDNFKAQLEKS
jgi:RND family efflux transporter MFP subunit